jgi:pimeloyl-ACP methyl ester carboxylesterase
MRKLWTVAPLLLASTIVNVIDLSEATASESAVNPLVKEGFVDVPAGHIYYQDSGGKGAAVVFLHPGSGNALVFENQIEPFVKAGFRFIAYDRAGQGKSTRPAAGGEPPGTAEASTPPELEQLMDALNIRKFHIVGAAGGGGVGLQYTVGRPQRVLSITVSNSIGNVQDATYTEMGRRIRPAQFNALPVEMQELGPSYRAANAEGVQRWLQLSRQGMTLADPGTPGAADPARGGGPRAGGPGAPPAPGAPGAGPPGGGTPVTFAALEKLPVPTLLLTGDADFYTPPSVLRMFKEHMPRAEMFIIPESGHAAHWENPAEFNRRVLAFVRKH